MNFRRKSKLQKWIGLIQVEAIGNNSILGSAKGAFVTAIAYADSSDQFKDIIKKKLVTLKLNATCFEDIEQLSVRLLKYSVSKELLDATKNLHNKLDVVFGNFHTYDQG